MSLTLNTNVASLSTQQYLNVNTANATQALQQLSSGNRLNSAADDPAGYAIAYKLGVKSASLTTAVNNGNQALAMLQTAQGGIQQIGNILTQLKQIATEAASSNTDTSDLPALQTQVSQLETEINNIAVNTQYGGVQLLQGANTLTGGETQAQQQAGIDSINVGAAPAGAYGLSMTLGTNGVTLTLGNGTTTQTMFVTTTTMSPGTDQTVNFNNLGISLQRQFRVDGHGGHADPHRGGRDVELHLSGRLGKCEPSIRSRRASRTSTLRERCSACRMRRGCRYPGTRPGFHEPDRYRNRQPQPQAGSIGATQNEISYQVANLQSMNTNTQAAESTIKNTDYAATMSNFTQAQVAQQAGVAMLTQANALPQQILSLIKG